MTAAPIYRPETALGPDPDPNDPTPGMHLWGWMSPTELRWLAEQAATMSSIVEVGCLHGRSAYAMLTACPGPVYCIDPWSDDGWRSFMGSCGHFPNVRPMREASPGAAAKVGPVDMVFLDGDHDYAAVIADIEAWLPLTNKLLCGHDYTVGPDGAPGGFPGVKQAVDEIFGDQVVVAEGTAIWTIRP